MRQAFRILPVYTGDVSGVCSALYELGGMVVMHDPSGCNSTYNTHDETRWYDRDSLIFLSGLCAPDAILGNDTVLIDNVVKAAGEYSPAFIALCNSPIPYLTGTDFAGICRIIEERTGIPSFYIPTNGMHDYINGAGLAFERLAIKLFGREGEAADSDQNLRSVNILGMTPLDHAAEGACGSVCRFLEDSGWEVRSVWAMDNSVEDLRRAPEASVNLVVSSDGMRLAKYLRRRFGTPWVAGFPVGNMKERIIQMLGKAVSEDLCGPAYSTDEQDKRTVQTAQNSLSRAIVIGEPVVSCSVAQDLESRGIITCVIAATEDSEDMVRPGDRICRGEEETETALEELFGNNADPKTLIIADPLYKYVCPEGAAFEEFPHLAFSGRIYRSRFIDPVSYTFAKDN